MKHFLRYMMFVAAFWGVACTVLAQTSIRTIHKVKKKETFYGIAREYGVTVDELMRANPQLAQSAYQVKKGESVNIPSPSSSVVTSATSSSTANSAVAPASTSRGDVRKRAIRLGIMLPLHNQSNDGKRMVEYYRGVLMACDSLKKEGISTEVHAWNVPENDDIQSTLVDRDAARCDLIIGPYYSKHVKALSDFVKQHGILMVIPFSINAPELYSNRQIFQIFQNQNLMIDNTVRRFADWFKGYHPIIIDCLDERSTKGQFTAALRRKFDERGLSVSLTSLKSTDAQFLGAFSSQQPNVVVLNTARTQDLNIVFGKLSAVAAAHPDMDISVFGYAEWMAQASRQLENFYRYNMYIPTTYYMNPLSSQTECLQQRYRWSFHQDMMNTLPRMALSGFDHAYFFLKGLHQYGETFDGAKGRLEYPAVQTPLKFERVANGGLQNSSYMFVHYKPDHTVETINY